MSKKAVVKTSTVLLLVVVVMAAALIGTIYCYTTLPCDPNTVGGNITDAGTGVPIWDAIVTLDGLRCVTGAEVAGPINPPSGCRFHPRCPYAFERCFKEEPELFEVEPSHGAACFLHEEFHSGKMERGRIPSV